MFKVGQIQLLVIAAMSVALLLPDQDRVSIDHNSNMTATSAFRFKNVPPPAKNDAATGAKLTLLDGDVDPNGGDLSALTDGVVPATEDQPGANFFFSAGTGGGRFRIDLGKATEIAQVNSYSWHPASRGPQVYRLWAGDESNPKFNPEPRGTIDPASCGWKQLALVDTRGPEEGGQYGVSISNAQGSLGKYRYLLFDVYVTEVADNWGNTFYSEVDVVAKKETALVETLLQDRSFTVVNRESAEWLSTINQPKEAIYKAYVSRSPETLKVLFRQRAGWEGQYTMVWCTVAGGKIAIVEAYFGDPSGSGELQYVRQYEPEEITLGYFNKDRKCEPFPSEITSSPTRELCISYKVPSETKSRVF